MKLSENIEILDLALKIDNNLVISDVHMGYEEALNKQGYLLPVRQYKDTVKRIEKIFQQAGKVEKVIINGDLKHEFGKISETEWRNTLDLIDYLLEKCDEVVLIKGNHDKILEPIAEKRKIKIAESHKAGNILIMHGDKIPKDVGADTIVIGHEHPAIGLRDQARVETYKCFLDGKWNGKRLIVMPSFNLTTEGSDVLKEQLLSPFLKQDLDEFKVYVVGEKIMDFGKIRDLQ